MHKKYKYFSDPLKNAEFTEERCQFCGTTENCLEGVYFEKGDDVTSVCLECLKQGKATVEIPQFLMRRILSHLQITHPDKSNEEIESLQVKIVNELQSNPPVPWIQYNDWPVCNGDFMQYIGEWKRNDFDTVALNRDGKGFVQSVLDEFSKSKIDDIEVFWNDIGVNTAVFVFRCLKTNKITAVAQSY